jgi:hypothetical protein
MKIALGIIILAVLMLVGCNNVVTNKNKVTESAATKQSVQSTSPTSSPTSIQSSTPTNYVKSYEDETHKEIQYGKLSFNIGSYHIVSDTSSDNIETLQCEIDEGEGYSWTKVQMTITVRAIEKQDFIDTESVISYVSDRYPNYEKIKIYNNVTDDSEIISLFIVTEGELTNYIVSYKDASYLIQSDVDEIYLLKNNPSEYYEVVNQKIECANSFTANVNAIISYNDNEFEKAKYNIIQGKDGTKYSAELSYDNKEYLYNLKLKNEKGENLLTLSTHGEFNDIIKFLDVNMDGYADIQFLKQAGAMNNSYDLYIWDDTAKNFIKVKCDEMLSYFEVHDGYLRNWQKESANSGVIQKLVWKNKNTLIKESEEPYHAD